MDANKFEGEECSLSSTHGRLRYKKGGRCVQCAKDAAKRAQELQPDLHRESVKRHRENYPDRNKGIKYTRALRLLANYGPDSDAVAFTSELFGKDQQEVLRDREEFLARNTWTDL